MLLMRAAHQMVITSFFWPPSQASLGSSMHEAGHPSRGIDQFIPSPTHLKIPVWCRVCQGASIKQPIAAAAPRL